MKKALITGVTGQDGAYLARLLLSKGYQVHGLKRRSSSFNTGRIDGIYQDPHDCDASMFLHHGDMCDGMGLVRIIEAIGPDEIYNLAAMSHVHVSFEMPEYTADSVGVGTLRLLEATRILGLQKNTRIYHASTSELYGLVQETPQSEKTPFYPRSPYAVAKLYAYWIVKNYREAYGLHASNGILFNHESPLRGETFVTRKITISAGKIIRGISQKLFLGNLDAARDWGHASDYVKAMWLMLQKEQPDDYVVATGQCCTVREFVLRVFNYCGIKLQFVGEGVNEKGIVSSTFEVEYDSINEYVKKNIKVGNCLVEVDPYYFRPTEVDLLIGNPGKAFDNLGWKVEKNLDYLIFDMCQVDVLGKDPCFEF